MARIVFEVDIDAPARSVVAALTSAEGIKGWWTDQAQLDDREMRLGFPAAPAPFELRIDDVSERCVAWTSTGDFPPHWVGTTITWSLSPNDAGGTTVHFNHDGWASDDGPFPMSAYTWAQLQGRLKEFVETGTAAPLFTTS